jgi:hypothetical protein
MMKFGTAKRRKNRASAVKIRARVTNLDPSSHIRIAA